MLMQIYIPGTGDVAKIKAIGAKPNLAVILISSLNI